MQFKLGPYTIDRIVKTVIIDGKKLRMSRNEFALLFILVENFGKIMARDDIIERMWGARTGNSYRAADNLIRKLRKKLPFLKIQTIYGLGYRLIDNMGELEQMKPTMYGQEKALLWIDKAAQNSI